MVAAQRAETFNLIRCTVGPVVVGFDLDRVVGVERGERLAPCPAVPGSVGRIANRAGEWVVYPLAWWLGSEPGNPRAGQVVLFETPHGRFGLAVDRVSPSVRVERKRVSPPPRSIGPVAAALIAGVAVLDSGPLVLLDPDHLDPTAPELPERPVRKHRPPAPARRGASGRLLAIGCDAQEGCPGRPVVLCLPSENVVEVIGLGNVTPVPTGEDHVRGLIEWRGRPIPVLDPARWVGLATTDAAAVRGVVATVAGVRVALTTGSDVRLISADAPIIPARRQLGVRVERTLGVFDTTDATLVIPDWEQLV